MLRATFSLLITQLFRPHRRYAQTYFDDILSIVALNMFDWISKTIFLIYERRLSACARINCMLLHRTASCVLKKSLLRDFIGKRGLQADPAKVKVIVD